MRRIIREFRRWWDQLGDHLSEHDNVGWDDDDIWKQR